MRSWKSATSLGLGIALLAGACGGGAPAPAGPGDDPGGAPAADPGATPMRTVIVNQDSEPQAYPLEGGRYRMAWKSKLDDCPDGLTISIRKVDVLAAMPHPSPFEYDKAPDAPAFNTLLQRVPPGLYTFEQTDPSCEKWEIRSDRVGN